MVDYIDSKLTVTMKGIVKRFPGVVANDGVDFEARAGEVHALLGENGAGKSTLSNVLTGLYRPDEGTISLNDEVVHFDSPREALERGIGMVHQHFRLVNSFTVAENIILGEQSKNIMMDTSAAIARISALATQYSIAVDPNARIWQLSVGEQQRVEILKALYHGAKILILDEPTAVLTPQEADALFVVLRSMVAEGRTVIFISHKLDEVMAVADRITVLRAGKTVSTIECATTTTRDLARLMVGRDVVFDRVVRTNHAEPDNIVLQISNIDANDDRGRQALTSIFLTVGKSEIVAIAGVAGNGQRELAEVIGGMRNATRGTVAVNNEVIPNGRVRKSMSAGVSHIPEDRLHTGLVADHSVEDNLILKSYRRAPISKFSILRRNVIRDQATDVIEKYDVKTPGTTTPVRLLSGGNVQKILLAREFNSSPSVMVISSPTRGLDVGAIENVRKRLVEAADSGVGVLLISEDLEEIFALADRILVMYEGTIVGNIAAHDATRESIGLLMGGIAIHQENN